MPRTTAAGLCDLIAPGERLFLGGSAGEPTAFVSAMLEDRDRTRGWRLVTSFVPGINPVAVERLHPDAELLGLFPHPGSARDGSDGRGDVLPLSYYGFVRALRRGFAVDTLVLHVAPPDADGLCSLGPAVEFAPEALRRARRVLAVVNPNLPAMHGSVSVRWDRIEAWCESDDPLRTYGAGAIDPVSMRIAELTATLVEDGVSLQLGVGKAPAALLTALTNRRDLRLRSGLVTDGVVALAEAGALAADCPVIATAMLGGADFYGWLRDRKDMSVRGAEITHDPVALAGHHRLLAINSAVEVDLMGQANLEQIGGRTISASGGALDFAHAASRSQDGLSVIILPASGAKGQSRIVNRLPAGTPVALPRSCVDVVVTEHGVADLRGLGVAARAEALTAIAAPAARAELSDQWRT